MSSTNENGFFLFSDLYVLYFLLLANCPPFWAIQKSLNIFIPKALFPSLYCFQVICSILVYKATGIIISKSNFCLDLPKYLLFLIITILCTTGFQSGITLLPPKTFFGGIFLSENTLVANFLRFSTWEDLYFTHSLKVF